MREKTIIECRPHWTGFIFSGLFALFWFWASVHTFLDRNLYYVQNAIIYFVFGAVIILRIFITIKFTYLRLTETKIEGRKGFIKSRTLSTPLSKVQFVRLSNGLIGKIFEYHTIIIASAGTSIFAQDRFRRMDNAKEFVEAFEKELQKQK